MLPTDPRILEKPDLDGAIYDFINTYCLPPVGDHIYKETDDRAGLPAGTDYAVIKALKKDRRGTNIIRWNEEEITDVVSWTTHFQIDFYGEYAEQRALMFGTIFGSETGTAFFKPYPVSPRYVEVIQNVTNTEEAQQQNITCFRATAYIAYDTTLTQHIETFDKVKIIKSEVL